MSISSGTGSGSHMKITGLPYTSIDSNGIGGGAVHYNGGMTGDTYDTPSILVENNSTQAAFYKNNAAFASSHMDSAAISMHISINYESGS